MAEAKKGQYAQPPPWQSISQCPWSLLLKFRQPQLERGYLASIRRSVCMSDLNSYGLAAAAIFFEMVSHATKNRTSLFHWCRLILCMVIPSVLGLCCRSGRFPYAPNNVKGRLQVLPLVRILFCGMATLSLIMDHQGLFSKHSGQSLLDTPPTTTIAPLVFTSMGLRLPFEMHVWVQGIATLVSLPWVVLFHRNCAVNPPLATSVNEVGYGIEEVLVRISVFGFPLKRPEPLPNDYPCWLVGAFVHVFVGFVIPSFVMYILELRSRCRFLKSIDRDGLRDARELEFFWWCGVACLSLLGTVGTQTFWFIVKEIGKNAFQC